MKGIVQNIKFRKPTGTFDPQVLSLTLEEEYLKKNRTRNRTKTSFAPSAIGYGHGTCPRYWYHAFEGAEFVDNNTALGIANMEVGSAAHTRLEELLKSAGVLVQAEVEVRNSNPPIFGFIDALIRYEGEIVVIEIKTARQEVWLHRQAQMKPSDNHLFQLLIYLKLTGKTQGAFIYENKNTQEFLILPVNLNEKNERIIEEVFDWMRRVHENWEAKTLPERPFTKRSKICKNCPVYEHCWSGDKGEVVIEAMSVSTV